MQPVVEISEKAVAVPDWWGRFADADPVSEISESPELEPAFEEFPTIPMQPVVEISEKAVRVIDRAIQLLIDNPAWKNRTLMDLERETGIDHNTWAKAKRRTK
jgi:hypothetical protein